MKQPAGYINYWGIEKPQFTEMELALMEGGHSINQPEEKYTFLKSLKEQPSDTYESK